MNRLTALTGWAHARRLDGSGVQIGRGVKLLGRPIVQRHPRSEIVIGAGAVLCSVSSATALGVAHAVVLRTLAREAQLLIGEHVGLSGTSICARHRVAIGAYTLIGADAMIMDTDFHDLDPVGRRYGGLPRDETRSGVTVGSNVFLGARAIVLKGAIIGDNSVIGAGSVVSGVIPADVVAAGNPCRTLRLLEPTDRSKRRAEWGHLRRGTRGVGT